MKLQRKLVGTFAVLAGMMLCVSLFAAWRADRLGAALYEVGVVRLPSIQGLVMMSDGMHALEAAAERLVHENDAVANTKEIAQIQQVWDRFDQGWKLYEPLPQTDEEAIKWRAFVPAATAWRQDYTRAIGAIQSSLGGDRVQREEARRQLGSVLGSANATERRLQDIIALNYRVAEMAKQGSIANYQDMARLRAVMIVLAVAAAGGSLLFGLFAGRKLSRPIVAVAQALGQVAEGDRNVRVDVKSDDELGDMGRALNAMVESLRTSEAHLRLLGDNLPGCMIYQLERNGEGPARFLYVSAGVRRLHGFGAEAVLRDAKLFYAQIVPEDQPRLDAARREALRSLQVFHVQYRIRRQDGALRTMNAWSQPRVEAGNRVIWDGIEMDVTDRHEIESQRERLARVVDAHFDAAYWMDASWRIVYVNEAASRAVGYAKSELVGSHVSLIVPRFDPVKAAAIWSQLRTKGAYTTEAVHRRRDGSEFPVEVVSTHVRLDDQELNCGFARNISDRKADGEALRQQLDELKRWHRLTLDREDRVAELKAEINELCRRLAMPVRYPSQLADGSPQERQTTNASSPASLG